MEHDIENKFVKYPRERDTTTPYEALVYVILRSYMNKETLECYPSIETLSKAANMSKDSISKCIKALVDKGFITRRRDKKRIIYKFNEENKFEPFSYEFLQKNNLTSTEKGILILCQQYMFKDVGYGVLKYSDRELGRLLNIPHATLSKTFNSLEKKGYLTMGNINNNKQLVKIKQFNLTKLDQAIVFTLLEHGKDIDELKQRANKSDEIIDELTKRLEKLEKQERLRQRLEESSRLAEEELYRIRHGEKID